MTSRGLILNHNCEVVICTESLRPHFWRTWIRRNCLKQMKEDRVVVEPLDIQGTDKLITSIVQSWGMNLQDFVLFFAMEGPYIIVLSRICDMNQLVWISFTWQDMSLYIVILTLVNKIDMDAQDINTARLLGCLRPLFVLEALGRCSCFSQPGVSHAAILFNP